MSTELENRIRATEPSRLTAPDLDKIRRRGRRRRVATRSAAVLGSLVVVALAVVGLNEITQPPIDPIGSEPPSGFVSPDDVGRLVGECIAAAGFPVEPLGGRSWHTTDTIPRAQTERYEATIRTCEEAYPVDPRASQPLARAQLEAVYRHRVEVTAPCLEELGFAISAPPGHEAFTAVGAWAPMTEAGAQVSEGSQRIETWHEAQRRCTTMPPFEELMQIGK